MSLDVCLHGAPANGAGSGIFVREDGSIRELTRAEWGDKFPGLEPVVATSEPEEVFTLNITHNLNKMADAAGIYEPLWRPEEIGIVFAKDLIGPLEAGLAKLRADPDHFRQFNPSNGWGNYEDLVHFVEEYLNGCRGAPNATVSACR